MTFDEPTLRQITVDVCESMLGLSLTPISSEIDTAKQLVASVEIRGGRQAAVDVFAHDRPGLLYRIAMILSRHGVNLLTAKITTLGERAEDVFLIDGGSLSSPKSVLAIETDLIEALRQ